MENQPIPPPLQQPAPEGQPLQAPPAQPAPVPQPQFFSPAPVSPEIMPAPVATAIPPIVSVPPIMAVAPVQKKSKKWLLILAVIVVIAVIAVVVGLALGGTSTPAKSAAAKSTATKQKAAATAPEEEQEFDSTVLGVTATYPLSWTVTDADGPVPSFLVATNTPDDIQTPISTTAVIVVSKEVSDKSASTYAQKIIDDNIQTIGTTFTVVSQSTKKVAGQDAVVVNSTYTANKIASKEQDIVIVKEGTAYRMSFATAADQWSKNQSVFDTFLKTVTFDQKT